MTKEQWNNLHEFDAHSLRTYEQSRWKWYALAVGVLVLLAVLAGLAQAKPDAGEESGGQRPPALSEVEIPMEYDPNLCAGEVMDWAFCEPNIAIIYAAEFYTLTGRPAQTLDVTLGGGQIMDVSVFYEGRYKDPNNPGWFHKWQIGYTPRWEGTHHINIAAAYGKKSFFEFPWTIPPGQNESDTRTILLTATTGDRPFIRPSLYPSPPAARLLEARKTWVKLHKLGKATKSTKVWR